MNKILQKYLRDDPGFRLLAILKSINKILEKYPLFLTVNMGHYVSQKLINDFENSNTYTAF